MTVPLASNASPILLSQVFDEGDSFEDFRDALAPDNPGRLDLELPVALAGQDLAFRAVADLRVLAIVEDWCKDSRDALPVLEALVASSPGSELRVVRRDAHPDLMLNYLKDGRFASIPVFVFLDRDFNELGLYVERPASVTRLRRSEREEIVRRDPRFSPPEAKPSAFEEPTRSDLKAAVLELRRESQPQASVLIAAELAVVAERIAATLTDRASGSPVDDVPVSPAPRLASALAGSGPLQIVDVGEDDCEIEEAQ